MYLPLSKSLDKYFIIFQLGHYAATRRNFLSLKILYGKLEELLYYTSATKKKLFLSRSYKYEKLKGYYTTLE
jgi:hypothetical protein